jgi:hypothetical protein
MENGPRATDIHHYFDLYNGNIRTGDTLQFCKKEGVPNFYKVVIDFEFELGT